MNFKKIIQDIRDWFKNHFKNLPEKEQHVINTAILVVNWLKGVVNAGVIGAEVTPSDVDNQIVNGASTTLDEILKELFTLQGQTPAQRLAEAIKLIMSLTKDHKAALYLQIAALFISRQSATTGEPVKPSEAVSIAHERYQDITANA